MVHQPQQHHCLLAFNNKNNNNKNNVHDAVIVAVPFQQFTQFIWWMPNIAEQLQIN